MTGVGPRTPGTNVVPGGPIRDAETGAPLVYLMYHRLSNDVVILTIDHCR